MPDYSLVPVDYQPDFSGFSLIPVDYDPFSADGVVQQAQTKTQPAQTQPETPPLRPASTVSAQTAAPIQPNPYPGGYPPGARMAKDGHHYVADPKRTGKYLLVVHHA
jgi:hypothetical protein